MDSKVEAYPNNSDFNPGQDLSQFDIPEWALVLAMALLDLFSSGFITPFYMAQNIRPV
jgi:hypothetical protein